MKIIKTIILILILLPVSIITNGVINYNISGMGYYKNGTINEYNNEIITDNYQQPLTGIKLNYTSEISNPIEYQAHVSGEGWTGFVKANEYCGSIYGNNIEAIEIKLNEQLTEEYNLYYRTYVQNYGWLDWTNNGVSGSVGCSASVVGIEIQIIEKTKEQIQVGNNNCLKAFDFTLDTHIGNYGWLNNKNNGEISGQYQDNNKIEAFKININEEYKNNIQYRSYVSCYGWQDYTYANTVSGTVGKNQAIEAIEIKLLNDYELNYDIYYRVYTKDYGWLGWENQQNMTGTIGIAESIQAIQVHVFPKNIVPNYNFNETTFVKTPELSVATHVQNIGWMDPVYNGGVSGTLGKALRIESIIIGKNTNIPGSLTYQAHVENKGWIPGVNENQKAGTEGWGLKLEALTIGIHGEISRFFDVCYRVHAQNYGWLGWTKNGEIAGTTGVNYRLEAIEVKLMPKHMSVEKGDSYKTKPVNYKPTPVYYSQRDGRWANKYYGPYNMDNTGCVPTAIAMALSGIFERSILPDEIANYLYRYTNEFNKIYIGASGLAIKQTADAYHVNQVGINHGLELDHYLNEGKIVVAIVDDSSPFITRGTHAIVLFGFDNGYTNVYDPYDARKNGRYSTYDLWYKWRSLDSYDLRGGHAFVALG